MSEYFTVLDNGSAEQIIEKSRFIAYVAPVETREEAEKFIAEIKSKHKDATHNVPAMVLGEKMQIQWASDDGEPQGTSGAPMVQMMVKEGITNVALVVTRYFGGIKLGTGGLVRAYTSSAKLGLEAAGLCKVVDMNILTIRIEYSHLAKIQNLEKNIGSALEGGFDINDLNYTDVVTLSVATLPEKTEEIKQLIANITNATEEIISENVQAIKVRCS